MFCFRLCLVCVLTVLCISSCVGSYHTNKCAETDKQALLNLKHGFADGRNILSSWNGEDCCKWKGISCNNLTGRVTTLDLPLQLGGNIDSSICKLQHLTFLDLSFNDLEGEIPKCIGSLGRLIELYLAGNELVGSVPYTLANLSNLQNLDLQYNYNNLVVDDLEWLSHLSNLRYLALSYINLSRAIDWTSSISKIPYLVELYLVSCGLPQVNPKSIPHMNSSATLQILDLSGNELNSSMSWVLNVSKVLTRLDLSYNSLHSVPDGFANMISLQYLDLSHNELSGTLPYTIGQLYNLTFLSLSSNKLNGIISEAHLFNLSRLETLYVNQNSLSFNLNPNQVPPFQLQHLFASSCILGPQFPTWLKYQRKLVALQISNTSIKGMFPKWLWGISSSLEYLNVSHNKLNGVLPKPLSSIKGTYFSTWDFSFNNFSGPLPPFPELNALLVSNNMFSGSLSSFCAMSPKSFEFGKQYGKIPSLTLCKSLRVIDFGDNIVEGTVPTWIGHNLHGLIVLSLRGNKIQGSIPISLCKILSLQVLDLSTNNITGKIPECLSRITALSNIEFRRRTIFYYRNGYDDDASSSSSVDETILAWKGQNRAYGKNLGLMTFIDLSGNHLTGGIPQSLTTLMALAGLNLSRNNLTGFIPNNIGHMERLESLDLSINHLCGRMPASFSNLSFLSYMNLSFNNLSGEIPVSIQLQSFDASTYVGNIGLCGPPLINRCPGDVVPPIGRVDKNVTNEEEGQLINFGFYISLGLGFFVGFLGVCGTLLIKSSWRHAYFQFFNNINDWIFVSIV
ncbi:Receptor-like protein 12, partial [Mucuna pruriens]